METPKAIYDEYCRRWEEYKKNKNEFLFKRMEILSNSNISENIRDELVELLEEEYAWNSHNFGPFTKIYSSKDLQDPKFLLPGIEKPYLHLGNVDKNIPESFGKHVRTAFPKTIPFEVDRDECVICGIGYDDGDFYILLKHPISNKETTVNMNTSYKII